MTRRRYCRPPSGVSGVLPANMYVFHSSRSGCQVFQAGMSADAQLKSDVRPGLSLPDGNAAFYRARGVQDLIPSKRQDIATSQGAVEGNRCECQVTAFACSPQESLQAASLIDGERLLLPHGPTGISWRTPGPVAITFPGHRATRILDHWRRHLHCSCAPSWLCQPARPSLCGPSR